MNTYIYIYIYSRIDSSLPSLWRSNCCFAPPNLCCSFVYPLTIPASRI